MTNWSCCEVSQWERIFTKQQKQKSEEKGLPYKMVLQQRRQGCVFVQEGTNKEPFTYTHAHVLYSTVHECLLLTRQMHLVCELHKWAVNNHVNNLRYSWLTRSQEGGLNNCLNPIIIYCPLHGKEFLEIKAASQMTCRWTTFLFCFVLFWCQCFDFNYPSSLHLGWFTLVILLLSHLLPYICQKKKKIQIQELLFSD